MISLSCANLGYADEGIIAFILKGDSSRVRDIIKKDVTQCNVLGDNKNTPLHIAASLGKSELVEILVTCTKDIDAKNSVGTTALMFAVMNGEFKSIEVLLKNKAKTTIKDQNGKTVFELTDSKIIKELLSRFSAKNNK